MSNRNFPFPQGVPLTVELGRSWKERTIIVIKYDFKPASIDLNNATLHHEADGSVVIRVSDCDGNETVAYTGHAYEPKAGILLKDPITERLTLERINHAYRVKYVRPHGPAQEGAPNQGDRRRATPANVPLKSSSNNNNYAGGANYTAGSNNYPGSSNYTAGSSSNYPGGSSNNNNSSSIGSSKQPAVPTSVVAGGNRKVRKKPGREKKGLAMAEQRAQPELQVDAVFFLTDSEEEAANEGSNEASSSSTGGSSGSTSNNDVCDNTPMDERGDLTPNNHDHHEDRSPEDEGADSPGDVVHGSPGQPEVDEDRGGSNRTNNSRDSRREAFIPELSPDSSRRQKLSTSSSSSSSSSSSDSEDSNSDSSPSDPPSGTSGETPRPGSSSNRDGIGSGPTGVNNNNSSGGSQARSRFPPAPKGRYTANLSDSDSDL